MGSVQVPKMRLGRVYSLLLLAMSLPQVLAHTTTIEWMVGSTCSNPVATFYDCSWHSASQPSNGGGMYIREVGDTSQGTFVQFDSDTGVPFDSVPWIGGCPDSACTLNAGSSTGHLACPSGSNFNYYRNKNSSPSCRQGTVGWLDPAKSYEIMPSATTVVEEEACPFFGLGSFQVPASTGGVDTEPPTFLAGVPTATVSYSMTDSSGAPSSLPDFSGPLVVTDNCGTVTITQSPAPGSFPPGGVQTVTFTATDEAGNAATATFSVNVPAPPERECTETEGMACHQQAYCRVITSRGTQCVCPTGMIGDGDGATGCSATGWTARVNVDVTAYESGVNMPFSDILINSQIATALAAELFGVATTGCPGWNSASDNALSFQHYLEYTQGRTTIFVSMNAVFATEAEAICAAASFNSLRDPSSRRAGHTVANGYPGLVLDSTSVPTEARVYTWDQSQGMTRIFPVGLEIDTVYFKSDCEQTGCWVVDFTYTTGMDGFSTFYIPRADTPLDANGDPMDFSIDYTYPGDVMDTFKASNFPCSTDSNHEDVGTATWWKTSTCCIKQVKEDYRPSKNFENWYNFENALQGELCPNGVPDVVENPGDAQQQGTFGAGEQDSIATRSWSVHFPYDNDFLYGGFSGMDYCYVVFQSVDDPYIRQYKATMYCDEKEMRYKAAQLKGTVGVEYTVDTFLGISNYQPTGTNYILDTFASQTALHFEKTDFFSVSTHGTNSYTFLEYVNMRLVAVYDEDTDPTESVAGNADRSTRTNPSAAAHYVQVTFTLGAQYQPIETGIVPLDSVRVGKGDFFPSVNMQQHTCVDYPAATGEFDAANANGGKTTFDARMGQTTCAPAAVMCNNPASIPDQFVAFNVPLGVDWLPPESPSLDQNVFVSLVVSAIDATQIAVTGDAPNDGADAEQMKTTLSASIPVVRGGVNIFCDQVTAKTDLKDVINADIILGSAATDAELDRLTILEDIGSSDLSAVASQQINTDSIEASMMTLVVKGNHSYFGLGGSSLYGVQVEDVITVHIMEQPVGRVDEASMLDDVLDLLETPGADNNLPTGLDTDGYTLNGAFAFQVDRAANRAYLEPTAALRNLCPFNPVRPDNTNPFPTSCIMRRDIYRRSYPARNGGLSTAVEIPAVGNGLAGELLATSATNTGRDQCGYFMQSILGESSYAFDLGHTHGYVVAARYGLNDQYRRAFMINAGYEWTPTQTGGQSLFTLSQKIVMFALINLDEGFSTETVSTNYDSTSGTNYVSVDDRRRRSRPGRRMLLTTDPTENTGAGLSGAQMEFSGPKAKTPRDILASAFEVDTDRVATFKVVTELTQQQACMAPEELRSSLKMTMADHLAGSASPIETVQILSARVEKNGVVCGRRSLRKLLAFTAATADVEMVVVFAQKTNKAGVNTAMFSQSPGIKSIQGAETGAIDVSEAFEPKTVVGTNSAGEHKAAEEAVEKAAEKESSSSNVGLIAGVVGGVAGVVALAAVLFVMTRNKSNNDVAVVHVQTASGLSAQDLKSALAEDV